MLNKISNFFLSSDAIGQFIDDTTTSNPLLDENGQFNDASTSFGNIVEYLDSLQLFEKFMEKLPTIIIAVVVILIGYLLSRVARKLIVKTLQARKVDPSVYNFIKRVVSVTINFISILTAASMFINVTSLLAAVGAAGVTAGLGLQSTVAQFASGIQILLNHPFKTGDFVELNGVSGSVADIRFMNTVIITPDNKRIVIPNSHITTNHIINYSSENMRRVDFLFSISYSDNIEKAKAVIKEVALSNEYVLKDPLPEVYVKSHEASAICLTARVWCKVDKYWDVYFAMQENVKIALDKNNISIPFNQLDVHIINK